MATVESSIHRLGDDRSRRLLSGSRIALVALIGWFLLARWAGVSLSMQTQATVYLFGMVALNLPYGGYEHMVNLDPREFSFGLRYIVAYLALVAGFVAVFFVAPVVGLALAIAVAVAKGGHGGLRVLDATTGTSHLRTTPQRALAAFVRGGTVMIVPLFFWPGDFAAFSTFMVDMFEMGAFASVAPYFETLRYGLGAVFAVAAVTHVVVGYHRHETLSTWAIDAGETALLVAYFAVVPVVVAVGLYFPLWYSARQSARIAAVKTDNHSEGLAGSASPGTAIAAFVGGAIATFALAGVLFVLLPNPMAGGTLLISGVAFVTVFISIIALPHVVVGSWFDTDRGIWYVP